MKAAHVGSIVAGFALGIAAALGGAQAQTFPSEPVTLVVAWPPGGGSDISMRGCLPML